MSELLAQGARTTNRRESRSRSPRVRGKNILVLGLAREGASLARYLAQHGARVTVTDMASPDQLQDRAQSVSNPAVRFVLGGHHPELVEQAELFFVSPGVPESNPVFQAASRAGLPIQSMTTLFFDLCPGPILGITGSSGKTTSTALIGHILAHASRHGAGSLADFVVGGNIGDPMLDLLPRIGPLTTVVLELSSFQLSILRRSPHIAVVTNISPNHLDRHGTMAEYVAAKRNIVRYQSAGDFAVLNAGDAELHAFAAATPAKIRWFGWQAGMRAPAGAAVQDGWVGLQRDPTHEGGGYAPVMPLSEIPLLGRHNVENVMAALATVDILGVSPEIMAAAVRTYRPAPHRLEPVGEHRGVRYVDDSIATSPARAAVALQALDSPILLIAGGRDKNLPWEDLAELMVRKVRALFLIGEAASTIEHAVRRRLACSPGARDCVRPVEEVRSHPSGGKPAGPSPGLLHADAIVRCFSLQDAVTRASRLAVPGDVVLLSPACASYDMFADYEDRGRAFARAVEALHAA